MVMCTRQRLTSRAGDRCKDGGLRGVRNVKELGVVLTTFGDCGVVNHGRHRERRHEDGSYSGNYRREGRVDLIREI